MTSAIRKMPIMPVKRSIRIVNAPTNFCSFGTRAVRKPMRTRSPPIAPPGITSEKKKDCMVSEKASAIEQSISRTRSSRCQRHAFAQI